jgi:hypothetical protein
MLKKGPEIKLPPLKVPGFVADTYHDLKERHLLPIVILLAIAIVAIPIAFGGGSAEEEGDEAAAAGAAATAEAGAGAEASQLVAKSAPGLRRYQRRLDDLKARDPFEQQYAGEKSSGGGSEAGGSGGGGSTATESFEPPSDGGAGTAFPGSGGGSGEGTSTTTYKRTYYSYAIDVRVTALGSGGSGASSSAKPKSTVRRNLPELTMLPSRETPAAIFVGATKDEGKALFVISSDVEAIFGDGRCVLGSQRCEMLMLEPGLPQTFVYGGAGRTFRIELLKVGLVESDKLNRAPLGDPKGRKKGTGKGKRGSG